MRFRLDSSLPDDAGWTTPSCRAGRVLVGRAEGAKLREAGRVVRRWSDALDALDWLDSERKVTGRRWVGYLAYELGQRFEPRAAVHQRISGIDWFRFGEVADGVADPDQPSRPVAGDGEGCGSSLTRDEYLAAVRRCLDYIAAGDVFQINLSQRLSLPFAATAASLYEALLALAPAAYGGLLEFDDFDVVCNSPELFLRVDPHGRVATRPIKGTRPRDEGIAEELLASEKDAAELNMIVDLERNDLGRICQIGSVRVSRPRYVEAHPTVYHGVAEVEGQLRPDVGLVELLAATFPGGSITGAPKIRAMQIIDELEPVNRGVYCGAIGHLDPDGSLQFNIAIRTCTLDRVAGMLHVPVGGGIVADSDPAEEYEETLVKARAALRAVREVVGDAATPEQTAQPHAVSAPS